MGYSLRLAIAVKLEACASELLLESKPTSGDTPTACSTKCWNRWSAAKCAAALDAADARTGSAQVTKLRICWVTPSWCSVSRIAEWRANAAIVVAAADLLALLFEHSKATQNGGWSCMRMIKRKKR